MSTDTNTRTDIALLCIVLLRYIWTFFLTNLDCYPRLSPHTSSNQWSLSPNIWDYISLITFEYHHKSSLWENFSDSYLCTFLGKLHTKRSMKWSPRSTRMRIGRYPTRSLGWESTEIFIKLNKSQTTVKFSISRMHFHKTYQKNILHLTRFLNYLLQPKLLRNKILFFEKCKCWLRY